VQIFREILVCAHVLAGAVWFGAMLYSLVIVHPRARSFFQSPRVFEEFIASLAAGARWKVLGGCAFIVLTGVGLLVLPASGEKSTARLGFVITKTILFTLAVGLFCFTSWKMWPARILAGGDEIPKFQRHFRVIAVTLLVLVGLCMVLGVLGSHLYAGTMQSKSRHRAPTLPTLAPQTGRAQSRPSPFEQALQSQTDC